MRFENLSELLLLALFAVQRANAYVHSCEEVKNRIVNNDRHTYNTTYACVVLQEGFTDFDQLKKLALVSGTVTHYFDEVAARDDHCIQMPAGKSPFRVTGLEGLTRECTQEFTLLFTSYEDDETHLYALTKKTQTAEWRDGSVTLVAPQTGIRIQTTGCASKLDGTFTVMTGVGTGTAEGHYMLGSWNCRAAPDWVIVFGSVVTISNDYTTNTEIVFSTDLSITARPGDIIAVYSNGLSDDLQNLLGGIDHRAAIQFKDNSRALVTANLKLNFDTGNYGSIALKENAQGTEKQFHNGTYTEQFNTDYFEIGYLPTGLQPIEIGTSQDSHFIDIRIGQDVLPATGAPANVDHDPYCNCAVDASGMANGWKTTEIWLDVVVVMDTSEAMGAEALQDATKLVNSLISADNSDFLITNPSSAFYTRIGVISMGETAEVIFNLNMTEADKVQASIKKGLAAINVNKAFDAAYSMLQDGLKSKPERANTRQVVYFMTDSEPSTILEQPFKTFKNKGIIIVNNFIKAGEPERLGLKKFASNGYYYSSNSKLRELQTFCKANCFCGANTITYDEAEPQDKAEGGCYRFELTLAPFVKAKAACQAMGGILPVIHDDQKNQFMLHLNNTGVPFSDYYWIGYQKATTGEWQWEDDSSDPYTNWAPNEPSTAEVSKCAYVDRVLHPGKWGAGNCNVAWPYACEYAPCSVGSKNC